MKNNNIIALEFNLLGFDRKDIDVKLTKKDILIKANKHEEKTKKEKDFESHEKKSNFFEYYRTLPLIDEEKAKINFSNGILKIEIPKK